MDLGPALSPELLFAADPLARGPPDFLRPPGRDPTDATNPLAPFDLLLQLLGNGLPTGESLPTDGADSPLPDGALPATGTDSGFDASLLASLLPALAAPSIPPALAPAPATDAAAVSAGSSAAPAPAAARSPADQVLLAAAALASAPAPQDAVTPAELATTTDTSTAQSPLPSTDANTPSLATTPSTDAAAMASSQTTVLDMLRALEGAVHEPVAAPPGAARRELGLDDPRDRAPRVAAAQTAQAAVATTHAAENSAASFDLKAPAAAAEAPALVVKSARLDDNAAISVALPAPGADASAASGSASASAFALLGSHGASSPAAAGTQAAAAQLPAQFQTPVDAHAARWHDALASRIQWLVDHNVGEAQIKLNPPELGALDVKISMQDDKTFVQMTTHSSAARDELAQSLPRLRELLSSSGLDLGGATVSQGRDERGAFQPAPPPISRAESFASLDSDDAPVDLARVSRLSGASRIDLFA